MPLPFIIIGAILAIAYASLMIWYWIGWLKTPSLGNSKLVPSPSSLVTKISVIIAARNEEATIEACLQSIIQQSYKADLFEVILVDDHSTDATVAIAKRFEKVRIIASEKGVEGKKKAIERGIGIATGKLIVTTDADCMASPDWLLTIAAYYELHQPVMIAGPVYFSQAKGIQGIWQVLDFAGLMSITAASIKNGLPQMCNGANLIYEKAAFEKVGGFTGIDGVPTGDDVLLMMKMHRQYPGKIHFLKSRDAIVHTAPQPDLSSLVSQRLRWVSKSKVFPDGRITGILVLAYFFNLFIVASLGCSFIYANGIWLFLTLFLLKMVLEFPLLYGSLGLSKQRRYLWHLPWVQALHLVYVVVIGPLSLFGGYRWKERCY